LISNLKLKIVSCISLYKYFKVPPVVSIFLRWNHHPVGGSATGTKVEYLEVVAVSIWRILQSTERYQSSKLSYLKLAYVIPLLKGLFAVLR
jgi:hypothetical protein